MRNPSLDIANRDGMEDIRKAPIKASKVCALIRLHFGPIILNVLLIPNES